MPVARYRSVFFRGPVGAAKWLVPALLFTSSCTGVVSDVPGSANGAGSWAKRRGRKSGGRPLRRALLATSRGRRPDAESRASQSPTHYEERIKLNMELMAFSAAADYSRVAVLKIGDRMDDHRFTMNGQTFKFHDASHRAVSNGEAPSRLRSPVRGPLQVSGVNKMLKTLLTAAGVTKAGGAPTDDFGEPSLPKGIFSELLV